MHDVLISPFGGSLIDLIPPPEELEELKAHANRLPSIQLSERAVCDLEMLATGGFSPLDRFMGRVDYESVLDTMRLSDGQLFPIPVTLPLEREPGVHLDGEVALRNAKNELLAVMAIEEIYPWDPTGFAEHVCGTQDPRHPLVAEMHRWGRWNSSGRLTVLQLPRRYDFHDVRLTPAETRTRLERLGRPNVIAFQMRDPFYRTHEALTKRVIKDHDGVLLLHPAVGMANPGDVDYSTRMRSYKALAQHYFDSSELLLSLLPLAPRKVGPREALWHAVVHRNYGANALIVDRDHAEYGLNSSGTSFYEAHMAQQLVAQHEGELGVRMIPSPELVYLPDTSRYDDITNVPRGARTKTLSQTQVQEEYLSNGKALPDWFIRPEVAEILGKAHPPRHQQGVCIWFTGLSGAGKSTTAEVLTVLLLEHGRQVTVLDGDVVRTHLSKGLGFSREDRDVNIRRIGFVAAEIVQHWGTVVCAAVSPYRATRNDVRNMMEQESFVEVFVDTPLSICEGRDAKGMYAKARRGEIKGFTGVDDPYEPPIKPEITLDTVRYTSEENARQIIEYLEQKGFIRNHGLNAFPQHAGVHAA